MDPSPQRDPYRVAFEQARSLFHQLTVELDALDRRHAALLSATKALETMISQRAGSPSAPGTERPTASAPPPPVQLDAESVTHVYVHRELPNAMRFSTA